MINFTHPTSFDIEVETKFLTTQEGGRINRVCSGYRPQFHYNDCDWDAAFFFANKECVELGETTIALVVFLSPEMHLGRVYVGLDFQVREGLKIVGKGKVTQILHLPQSAALADKERPKRYYSAYWAASRSDEYSYWGGVTYYFECASSGYPLRQIEIYDNGVVLFYNEKHSSDDYGMLSDTPIELFDETMNEISADEFEDVVTKRGSNAFNH